MRRCAGSFSVPRCRTPLSVALLRFFPAPSGAEKSLVALDALILSISIMLRRPRSFSAPRRRSPVSVALLRLPPASSGAKKSLAALDAFILSISITREHVQVQSNKCVCQARYENGLPSANARQAVGLRFDRSLTCPVQTPFPLARSLAARRDMMVSPRALSALAVSMRTLAMGDV